MFESTPIVVAIDQGTSSTKAVALNGRGEVVARASVPIGQAHPRSGWVEQDADELFASVRVALGQVIEGRESDIVTLGVSSQRESAVVWDRQTGAALGPVLGWQDRRTSPQAKVLMDNGLAPGVRALSGLPIDPMFSALKFRWLLDAIDPERIRSRRGEIALGTVDSWILFCLTGEHRIELGNASRTQLLDIAKCDWSEELAATFDVPLECLPRIVASDAASEPIRGFAGIGGEVRVTGVLGDSHAALYGHGCRAPGAVKVTYGTGSSIMGLMEGFQESPAGLVCTVAWSRGTPTYAFEGNILSAGATLVWLGNLIGVSPDDLIEAAKLSTEDSVQFVPAFAGLGAPTWDENAQAVISGFDLGSERTDIARAAVESIPHQIEDVLVAADSGLGHRIGTILADGGPSANRWLMQLQADLSQRTVVVSPSPDLSAIGVAHLAGASAGIWTDDQTRGFSESSTAIRPAMSASDARRKRQLWAHAVLRARASPPD